MVRKKPAPLQRAVVIIDDVEIPCPNRAADDHHRNGRHYVQIHVGKLYPDKDAQPLEENGPRETIVIEFPQNVYRLDLNRVAKILKRRRARQEP